MSETPRSEQGIPGAWQLYCPTCKTFRAGHDWTAAPGGMPIVTCRFCRNSVAVPDDKRWQSLGAGRKPSVDGAIRRMVYLHQRHDDLITRQQQPGATYSQALRALLALLDQLLAEGTN